MLFLSERGKLHICVPMQDTFKGTVRDISAQGLGVVDHPDGRVFFVRGSWPGDEGEFRIQSLEKRYGFADIVSLNQRSPDRVEVPCPHSGFSDGLCGGCPWMGINYEKQLEQKQKMVSYLLKRNGAETEGITELLPILPSEKIFAYRNRAEFKTDGKQLGYVTPGTKILAPIENCRILTEKNQQTLQTLRSKLPHQDWAPSEDYLWSYLQIDDWMEPSEVQPNKKRPFFQANSLQNQAMREWLRRKLKEENRSLPILELFCGSGNFTKVLHEEGFKNIHAVEGVPSAIEKLNAHGWSGVHGQVANLFIPSQWKNVWKVSKDAEVLLLDPPREGFRKIEGFLEKMKKLRRILYISCETREMTSEVKILKKYGWVLKSVQPLDQFPHTPHVETLSEIIKAP